MTKTSRKGTRLFFTPLGFDLDLIVNFHVLNLAYILESSHHNKHVYVVNKLMPPQFDG